MSDSIRPPLSRPAPTPRRGLRRAFLLGLLCSFPALGLLALPARTGTLDGNSIKETVFPNGLRLVVKEAHATELASVQVWVRAGGFREDEETAGTAHVIEHLVFKGSEGNSLDDTVENLGGLVEASTEKDWTRFGCTVAGRYVGKVMPVIADALRKPRFRPEDWEAEKPVVLEEVGQARNSPDSMINIALYEMAFEKHPYRNDVRGTPRFVNRLDLKKVREYFQKYYVPSNMTVVVVGDVDAAGVERVTRQAFEADKPAPKTEDKLPEPERACENPDRRSLTTTFSSGYVGMAFPAPGVKDDPEVYAMDVLITLLEHNGVGRLRQALKNTAEVQALFETRRQPGLTTIIAATGDTNPETVEAVIRREIELLGSRPIPEAEVTAAKRQLRGSYVLDNEAYSGQAGSLGYYDAIYTWKFAVDYLAHVEQVTPEQVQALAKKYLDPKHSVTVVLKPRPRTVPGPPRSGT